MRNLKTQRMMNKGFKFRKTACTLALLIISLNASFGQKNVFEDVKTLKGMDYTAEQNKSDFTTKSYRDGNVVVTELMDEYLFPKGIDPTGNHIIIQTFGTSEESYYWSAETGINTFPGKGTDITTNLKTAGDFLNNNFPGGGSALTAGTYSIDSEEWTFLGVNPDYPTITADDYNSAWGLSDDGSTVVGLQIYDGWSAMAFKWTEEEGYTNIGNVFDYDSRASGISRNGEMIFGWASTSSGFWTPVAWHDGTYTEISPGGSGEAMCASPEGTYVAGLMDNNAFIWSVDEGMIPFGTWEDYPTIVMEDGSAFGFTGVFPPPVRRAFYKTPEGEMLTFNDYAESRGMSNAQSWTFYSVNNVTPDGNKFIGAGINPMGQDVCFLIDFASAESYALSLSSNPAEAGVLTGSGSYEEGYEVNISAVANEGWEFLNWTDEGGNVVSIDSETTITMPAEDIIFTANFIEINSSFTLDVIANPTEGGVVSGSGNYEAGTNVEITAVANTLYAFENWTDNIGNIISTDAVTTITMPDENIEIIAQFKSTVGIENLSNNGFNIQPNPAHDQIILNNQEKGNLKLFNSKGQLILEKFVGENHVINITEIDSGIYIITIETSTTVQKGILIKE